MNLYVHQKVGVEFLTKHKAAMLCDEMGAGKSRQALAAALRLYRERKIDRVLILAPAAVRISWFEEVRKLAQDGQHILIWCSYNPKKQIVLGEKLAENVNCLPVLVVSYALLPQQRHVEALEDWCASGKCLLVCDESSFLKSRTAKQTRGAIVLARQCHYRWLLTGTPIANGPLDLYSQALVMFPNGAK
jgi:SNF2 family DNA or RNA helicase